jgi:hypothetical protein
VDLPTRHNVDHQRGPESSARLQPGAPRGQPAGHKPPDIPDLNPPDIPDPTRACTRSG